MHDLRSQAQAGQLQGGGVAVEAFWRWWRKVLFEDLHRHGRDAVRDNLRAWNQNWSIDRRWAPERNGDFTLHSKTPKAAPEGYVRLIYSHWTRPAAQGPNFFYIRPESITALDGCHLVWGKRSSAELDSASIAALRPFIPSNRRTPSTRRKPLARSATNKAKASAKKQQRTAPRPKAQITARAKLINVAGATGKVKKGAYQTETVNAVRLTIDVNMGAPAKAPGWPEFKQRNRWDRPNFIDHGLNKLKPAAKPKKGEEPTLADAFDKDAETKRLGALFDDQLRAKYERECQKANNANARYMQHAAAFAMFLALRGEDVQLTLAPIQQGFSEMFSGATPLLGAGEPEEDEPEDDDEPEDPYGDEDD